MANQKPVSVPLLHRFLAIGLVLLGAAFGISKYLGVTGLPPSDEFTKTMGYVMTGMSLFIAIVALAFLRRRVPERQPGQTVDLYWSRIDVAMSALRFWFVLEGAGIFAAVAYFLTGQVAAALAYALITVWFWISGPNAFAKP